MALSSWAVPGESSILDARNLTEALRPGAGTLREEDFALTPAPVEAGHAAAITPGRALIPGETFRQGTYFVWSDATDTVPWPAPDALPRIDTLILQERDDSYGVTQGPNGPVWKICPGAPASSPVPLSDAAIRAGHAEAGAWLYAYDVRVDPGQTRLVAGNITRRFTSISSRPKQGKLLVSTATSTPFRNWLATNTATRKAFTTAYWPPVSFVVPYTGEVKVTITGRGFNTYSTNSGVGLCYHLAGANTSAIGAYTDYEFLKRGHLNETASVVNWITGLNPGLTQFIPNVWVTGGTSSADINLHAGTLIVEPVL